MPERPALAACAANAAVAVARLKGRVAFAGPLGGTDDAVSNRILADLGNENVDCRGTVRVDGGTASVSLILLDASGEKTIATRRGVNLGRAFFGESMFHRARDASKVALVHLMNGLKRGGFVLLDTQFITAHLARFGAIEIPRERYLHKLQDALNREALWPFF